MLLTHTSNSVCFLHASVCSSNELIHCLLGEEAFLVHALKRHSPSVHVQQRGKWLLTDYKQHDGNVETAATEGCLYADLSYKSDLLKAVSPPAPPPPGP